MVLEYMSHSLLKSKMGNKMKCKLTLVLVLTCVLGGEKTKLTLDLLKMYVHWYLICIFHSFFIPKIIFISFFFL